MSSKESTLNTEACRIKQPQEQGLEQGGDEVLVREQVITKASEQEIRSIYFGTADRGPGESISTSRCSQRVYETLLLSTVADRKQTCLGKWMLIW